MDTDSQEATEETIFTGDDLMTGPPSPLVPPELAPQILDGIELCSSHLRKLFECLHKNDIEPFCQDEILIYHRCSQNRDATVRGRIYEAEETLGGVLPEDLLEERMAKLKSDATLLERCFPSSSNFWLRVKAGEKLLIAEMAKLKSDATLLERRFLLASGVEGVEGFRQRWSLNGQLVDTKKRTESLEQGMARKKQ